MNWQELTMFLIVLAAAIFVGRSFLQQFGLGEKSEKNCPKCTACGLTNLKPRQIMPTSTKR